MQILLIEPDVVLAKTYKRALEAAGHEVMTAGTAQGAVQAADAKTPQLVILELQLVSHSGVEFLYEFRSYNDWQNIPVVVLSMVPPAEFIDSWPLLKQELGAVAYYYKPHTSLAKLAGIAAEFANLAA